MDKITRVCPVCKQSLYKIKRFLGDDYMCLTQGCVLNGKEVPFYQTVIVKENDDTKDKENT